MLSGREVWPSEHRGVSNGSGVTADRGVSSAEINGDFDSGSASESTPAGFPSRLLATCQSQRRWTAAHGAVPTRAPRHSEAAVFPDDISMGILGFSDETFGFVSTIRRTMPTVNLTVGRS